MKSHFLPKGTELPCSFPAAAAQPLPSGSAGTQGWPLSEQSEKLGSAFPKCSSAPKASRPSRNKVTPLISVAPQGKQMGTQLLRTEGYISKASSGQHSG